MLQAAIAQLAEQETHNFLVGGSSPSGRNDHMIAEEFDHPAKQQGLETIFGVVADAIS